MLNQHLGRVLSRCAYLGDTRIISEESALTMSRGPIDSE
jgi:hypothetical protein